jgi:hypothetical protein
MRMPRWLTPCKAARIVAKEAKVGELLKVVDQVIVRAGKKPDTDQGHLTHAGK